VTSLDKNIKNKIRLAQVNEITEYYVYKKLAQSIKDTHNKNILNRIADDELKHYNFWKKQTKNEVKPSKIKYFKYVLLSKIFGITFAIKLMEKGEEKAQSNYNKLSEFFSEAKQIMKDEDEHEKQLINLVDEKRLRYVGSMVLGLNDALVELTGALAGLTFAFQKTQLIALAGLITGIAASFSMAASEYLSTKSEKSDKNPLRASFYTGFAYVFTVLFLIFPFFLLNNVYFALGFIIINAVIVIFIFTYYISIAKDLSFRKRFTEMIVISLGIAALTFFIGFLIRSYLQIEV
jgi:VIT1/CCC1 family predicted Fe2+/Mn2+ transporter